MNEDYSGIRDTRRSVNLGVSEAAVFAAASRLFAAHIGRGEVNAESEVKLMDESLRMAIALAGRADDLIKSENEI